VSDVTLGKRRNERSNVARLDVFDEDVPLVSAGGLGQARDTPAPVAVASCAKSTFGLGPVGGFEPELTRPAKVAGVFGDVGREEDGGSGDGRH